jgi:hypothetical protein
MTIQQDLTTVLVELTKQKQFEQTDGQALADALGMSPERLNHAVAILQDNGYVKAHSYMGTAPFDFGTVEITPQGRYEVERAEAEAEEKQRAAPVASPKLTGTREVVERALREAETLLQSHGATSAVDRLHTALHGYLKSLCDGAGIAYQSDASAARLLKAIRDNHPAFQGLPRDTHHATRILLAMGTAVDSVGTIRNTGSVAHANEVLVEAPEAMLVVNATRTILQYLDARVAAG